mgnify:CR=1 FL=1
MRPLAERTVHRKRWTLPAVVTCLLGVFAGLLLRRTDRTEPEKVRLLIVAGLVAIALGLVLGGALGNLTDRAINGSGLSGRVTDFLDFRIWPVFNLADTAIVVGAVLLALSSLSREEKREG